MTQTPPQPRKDLLISIVNGNDRGYIYECVESIRRTTLGVSYDIVVVDNCTGDRNLQRLVNMEARVLVNDVPLGFAANHAQALPLLDGYRYLLIFNDDAFPVNNAFKIMIDTMDAKPDVAIAGCHIADPDGGLQPGAAAFPTLAYFVRNTLGMDKVRGERYPDLFTRYIDFDKSQDVDWVSGCSMMIRTDYIRKHGFLDSGYFMYLEDADLCKRAHQHGCKVRYVAEARIVHYGGGSSKGPTRVLRPRLFVETQRSRLRYLRKDSLWQYLAYAAFINTFLPVKLIRSVIRGDRAWARETLAMVGAGLLR